MTEPQAIVSLVDVLTNSLKRYSGLEVFGTKTGEQWRYITYADFGQMVDKMRGGLASLGIGPGDKVGIISNNRVEWAVIAYAVYGRGAVIVPMYESQLDKDWEFIVRDSELKVLFVANRAILEKTKAFPSKIPSLKHIALMLDEGGGKAGDVPTYQELLKKGAAEPVPLVRPESTDMASLLYTSGTTGNPKGVVLSHGNVVSNVLAVQTNLPIAQGDRSLAFLPWAHSFGHTCELHILVSIGASTGICDANDKIVGYLAEVKPTVLFAVPRIFNRIYAGVEKQMASKPAPIRSLFRAGLRIAAKRRNNQHVGLLEAATLALCDRLVFSKVRDRFGGKLRYAVSGAAALAGEVADFVDGLGITVYEGYGLTETSPIVSCNVPGHRKLGSVGRPIPNVRVVIDTQATGDSKNGEIIVYGPNVMQGYYKNEAETDAVFTPDGGFRTGDMGYLDDDNYLYITGRIKEQYKLENGKYVVPSPLEERIKLSSFVSNVMVYGDNKPFNVALIVANVDALQEWGKEHGISQKNPADLLSDPKVRTKMREELDRVCADFKGYERIRNFALISEDFTLENDMLTPKLSVKRRNVLLRWQKEIDQLYA
jgi:long-chain acyl-CoA synthetase